MTSISANATPPFQHSHSGRGGSAGGIEPARIPEPGFGDDRALMIAEHGRPRHPGGDAGGDAVEARVVSVGSGSRDVPTSAVVTARSELDMTVADDLRDCLDEVASGGGRRVVLDLSKVTFNAAIMSVLCPVITAKRIGDAIGVLTA